MGCPETEGPNAYVEPDTTGTGDERMSGFFEAKVGFVDMKRRSVPLDVFHEEYDPLNGRTRGFPCLVSG
ncbi:Hypothetical predicted protein [Marmota monax]|uniref:Uncharacterized protein n=1 Tax=Marmota monax TaxID=9995 RepID=A0A5E4AAF4_MARMO|nr:Hypothetical predicted protein [Marmota monax]